MKRSEHNLPSITNAVAISRKHRMTLTEDDIIQPLETADANWLAIEESLFRMNSDSKSYVVLTDPESGSYIQCAGSVKRLSIELRIYSNQTFKHYVIGKSKFINPLSVSWATIECRVGPIRVHDSEVLTIDDACKLFSKFYAGIDTPPDYSKRNVTKMY